MSVLDHEYPEPTATDRLISILYQLTGLTENLYERVTAIEEKLKCPPEPYYNPICGEKDCHEC